MSELQRRRAREVNTKHGMYGTREYNAWLRAINRCENIKIREFKHYGGRGIGMDKRWRSNFLSFYKDMGPCPSGLTLERIDNNKGYQPGNCKWATWGEQRRNKRSNVWVSYGKRRLVLGDWARELGVRQDWLRYRVVVKGYTIVQIVNQLGVVK